MNRMEGKELADAISMAVNTSAFDTKGFVAEMKQEHKTLQQNFMREIVIPYLEALAKSTNYDERNAASVAFAKAVMERTSKEERALPYI